MCVDVAWLHGALPAHIPQSRPERARDQLLRGVGAHQAVAADDLLPRALLGSEALGQRQRLLFGSEE